MVEILERNGTEHFDYYTFHFHFTKRMLLLFIFARADAQIHIESKKSYLSFIRQKNTIQATMHVD
jgi:hypothetical protein